jgi:hypothetical protein
MEPKATQFFYEKKYKVFNTILANWEWYIPKEVDCWGIWVKVKKCSPLEDSNPYYLHSKENTKYIACPSLQWISNNCNKKELYAKISKIQMKLKKTFSLAHVFFWTRPTYIEPNATFNLLHLLGVILRGIRWIVVSI